MNTRRRKPVTESEIKRAWGSYTSRRNSSLYTVPIGEECDDEAGPDSEDAAPANRWVDHYPGKDKA